MKYADLRIWKLTGNYERALRVLQLSVVSVNLILSSMCIVQNFDSSFCILKYHNIKPANTNTNTAWKDL